MTETNVQEALSLESLVADVVDEFRQRQQAGERPDIEEYVARHPQAAVELRQVLASLQLLEQAAVNSPEPEAPALGELGDFRIVREVGRGGMGVVYEAEQISLGRRVALKVLPFAGAMDKRQLQRFQNEARAAASLEHPHIVPIYGVGCERGVHYYAMKFIDGQSLDSVLEDMRSEKKPPLPPSAASVSDSQLTADQPSLAPPAPPPNEAAGFLPPSPPVLGGRGVGGEGEVAPRNGNALVAGSAPSPPAPLPQSTGGEGSLAARPNGAATAHDTVRAARTSTLASFGNRRDAFRRWAELALQAAEALEHAHQSGVVHRDIKPANLLLDEAGKLWITDFGLAQIQSDARMTMTGDLVGTLRYMSPEQALAKRVIVDHRTDVYSLGATLYEMVTLQPVFAGQDRQELMRQIAFEDPLPPRRIDKSIPVEWEPILLKALEKNPNDRYTTAKELADDLNRYLRDEPTLARRPTLWQRGRKWARRHGAAVRATVAALFVVMVVVAGTAGWWLRDRSARESETERVVEAALNDASQWQNKRNVAEALGAAKRAAAILAAGASSPALEKRVASRLADLTFAMQLEEIRTQRTNEYRVRFSEPYREYLEAFRNSGIDIEELSPDEAGRLIRERSVADEIAASLDDWVFVAWLTPQKKQSRREHLLRVALAVDANPGRTLVRNAILKGNVKLLAEMLTDVPDLPPSTAYLMARVLEAAGNKKESLRLSQEFQRRYPEDFWISNWVAWSHAKAGDTDEAIRFYTASTAIRRTANGTRALGQQLLRKGRIDEAVSTLRVGMRISTKDAEVYSNLIEALEKKGEPDALTAVYREAKMIHGESAELHRTIGMALGVLNRNDDAIAALQEAIRFKPNDAVAHFELARVFRSSNQHDKAIAAYYDAIGYDPKHAPAHNELGILLAQQNRLDEGIGVLQELTRLNPELAVGHNNLGFWLTKKGKYADAIAALRQAIHLSPSYLSARNNLCHALAENGQSEDAITAAHEAITAAHEAIRLNPFDDRSHFVLGQLLRRCGQPAQAIERFHENLRLKNTISELFVETSISVFDVETNIGHALLDMGKFEDAITAYEEVLRRNKSFLPAQCGLAYAFGRKNRQSDAIAAYRQALKLKPKADTLETLTFGMKGQGQNGVDFIFLAMAHWQIGNQDEARKCYDKGALLLMNNGPDSAEFRAEAAAMLGVKEPAIAK